MEKIDLEYKKAFDALIDTMDIKQLRLFESFIRANFNKTMEDFK